MKCDSTFSSGRSNFILTPSFLDGASAGFSALRADSFALHRRANATSDAKPLLVVNFALDLGHAPLVRCLTHVRQKQTSAQRLSPLELLQVP